MVTLATMDTMFEFIASALRCQAACERWGMDVKVMPNRSVVRMFGSASVN